MCIEIAADFHSMAASMEQNIQNGDTDIETVTVTETENSNPFKTTAQKNEKEDSEKETRSSFEIEMQTILQKIKDLPSIAEEFETSVPATGCKGVYSKLCEVLKIREISAFITQLEDEKMDLSYQCLGPIGIIPVAKALASCKSVKILDLKYNKLGLKSLPPLISLIQQNEIISHLNLAANEIRKKSAALLHDLISQCFTVEFLDLSNNNLGDEELREIGSALLKVDSVKELFLNSNDFSSAKAQSFGSCISKCSALTKLDISCCHLEEGVMYIFGGLKISNLTVLNLSRNGIPNEAMAALASGLKGNRSLLKVDISYNVISNKGAVTLAPGLKGSTTLEIMILAHNPIQGSAATKLLASAGGNLKLLDLSGVRVNLAFCKTLRTYMRAGKELRVLFGTQIRYDLFPRDLSAPDGESLTEDNVIDYLEKSAEENGISLRNTLKSIHADFIAEQHAKFGAEKEEQKASATKDKGAAVKKDKGTAGKKNKAATGKKDKDASAEKDKDVMEKIEIPARPEMKTEEFAEALAANAIVPKTKVREVAKLLSEEGFVNMWKLIAKVKWKPDDLLVKIKVPKKEGTGDKKKTKDKSKKKK